MSKSLVLKKNSTKKHYKNLPKKTNFSHIFLDYCSFFVSERVNEQFAKKMSDSLICSFIMSNLSKSLKVALLS